MKNDFKFFIGNIESITFVQPRYPRTAIGQIPYPESCETPEEKRIFRRGWRACEQGRDIFENPYSIREEFIYSLYRAWEGGWLECYHHHPYRVGGQQPTNEECYQAGWESAQRGYPLNNYPIYLNENKRSIFQRGWDDFVNTH